MPAAGDYRRIDIGAQSVILVRGDDGEMRAFHNICRHRGAQLVTAERGRVIRFVCPYHQWTYKRDGTLINARQMGADFDKSVHGLKPVHLRSIAGLLFICLAEKAPDDIGELAAAIEPRLAPHDLRNAKVAAQIDLVEHGNWKLTMENNRECYHCQASIRSLLELVQRIFGRLRPGRGELASRKRPRLMRNLPRRPSPIGKPQAFRRARSSI